MRRYRSGEPVVSFDPEALRRWRQRRKLSHDALGAQVGVSRPNLIAYEQRTRRVGIDTLVALADALHVQTSDLMSATRSDETLADMRARCGMTKAKLAESLGLSRMSWANIEAGRTQLQGDIAKETASLLGVTVVELTAARSRGLSA